MECVKRESCPICNGSHHFSICFRNRHDDDLSPKRDTDNIVSAVIKTDSEDILTMSVIVNESNICKQLSEFWDLENLGIEAEVSDEENIDNDIMSEFEAGISYQNKRYKVKFPWKPNMKTLLENNEEIARKRFLKLRSRFKNDSSLFEDYNLVVNNYLSEKIIERVPFEEENLKHNIFFIYHIEHTKATHLEGVSDMTTEAFLACLRRFIARRSKPSVIWSDNATNFKGARNILNEWNAKFASPTEFSYSARKRESNGTSFHPLLPISVDCGKQTLSP
ncbi:uncharacterized protein TNCV_1114381 [Trichonephila clavipes]|nr:uncharacterized protein TNCV_1114381 [Trichonephila clavipes]